MVRSISLKRVLYSGITRQFRPLLTRLLSGPLRLQIDQQMFDKFFIFKTVFYGQHHLKGKSSTCFIRRPIGNKKYRAEGWLKYNARHSQPLGFKALPQENVLVTRSLDCQKIHLL